MTKLVIVQCGGSKIWKKKTELGAVPAKDAYTSPYFKKNRAYAEKFGECWMILSAKYGFIDPKTLIEDYNVTFKKKKTNPISVEDLRRQVYQKNLAQFCEIVVLGGIEYLEAVEQAFRGTGCKVVSPFEGLSIGMRMHAVDMALSGSESMSVTITEVMKIPIRIEEIR
ncbi:MAG: hypothetical protein QCI38_03975, partial [Candidatus Thermoplasmatota archaeon]|nr:hypothetical protein [Candidatus Thermoplasmatota archaeon]